ncbi:Sucrase/ferredoxin-like-domain-containing protein [Syncephalis plumigaleata]|nr:Sucrase/ferredoxin-like-domain-containing protein [Syncephalis plumigaleata]
MPTIKLNFIPRIGVHRSILSTSPTIITRRLYLSVASTSSSSPPLFARSLETGVSHCFSFISCSSSIPSLAIRPPKMYRLVSTLRSKLGMDMPTSSDGVVEVVDGTSYDLPPSHPHTIGLSECEGCAARDTCEVPDQHDAYPSYLTIDRASTLYGNMKPITRHAVISSGISARRWPSHVEKTDILEAEKISAAEVSNVNTDTATTTIANDDNSELDAQALATTGILARTVKATEGAGKWLVCTAERRPAGELMIFPEYKMVSLLDKKPADDATDEERAEYENKLMARVQTVVTKITAGETDADLLKPIPYRAVILICAHKRRDKRCGIAGPILHQQFLKALETRRQQKQTSMTSDEAAAAATTTTTADASSTLTSDDIGVFMVSHTGGHKFAGNVLIYPAGIWYGRVTACHVDAILDHTVLNDQVIRELYRGRLNPPTRDDGNF